MFHNLMLSRRYNDDRVQRRYEDDSEESETMNEFCKPRDMLLSVVSEFYCHGLARLKELRPVQESRTHSQTEILDQKCHMVCPIYTDLLH